jgi:Ni,Fe-hydrogenase III small subunit
LFGRSLKLRQVSAGGCNGCEAELNALANVNFDLQRYGIEWVASPRHADALVLTGPVTRHMAEAVQLAWDAMPEPRFVVSVGACTISGGLYAGSSALDRAFSRPLRADPVCSRLSTASLDVRRRDLGPVGDRAPLNRTAPTGRRFASSALVGTIDPFASSRGLRAVRSATRFHALVVAGNRPGAC